MTNFTPRISASSWHDGYRTSLEIGLIMALTVVLGFFHVPLREAGGMVITTVEQEVVQLDDIHQTVQPEEPPPPPKALIPVAVPDEALPDEAPLDFDASLDLDAELAAPPVPPAPPAPEEAVEEEIEPEIFVVVEEMPEIIGGVARLYEGLRYPEMAAKAGIQGMVVVEFTVSKDGVPMNAVVRKSASSILDRAAIDAIMKLRFTPGKQRGKPVMVRFSIPVRFRLTDG